MKFDMESALTEVIERALNRDVYIEVLITDIISPLDSNIKDRIKDILKQYRIAIDRLGQLKPVPIGIYAHN